MKQIIPRQRALEDVDEAVTYLEREASKDVAKRFVVELERAYSRISRYPQIGSPRFAIELNLPGLRAWPLSKFPYLVFYFEFETYLDVVRVLNTHRDIPDFLSSPEIL